MTVQAVEKNALQLPPRSRLRLAEKLLESVDDFASSELAAEWDREVERRVTDIESGATGIPSETVMNEARRAVHEARRLSSARRK